MTGTFQRFDCLCIPMLLVLIAVNSAPVINADDTTITTMSTPTTNSVTSSTSPVTSSTTAGLSTTTTTPVATTPTVAVTIASAATSGNTTAAVTTSVSPATLATTTYSNSSTPKNNSTRKGTSTVATTTVSDQADTPQAMTVLGAMFVGRLSVDNTSVTANNFSEALKNSSTPFYQAASDVFSSVLSVIYQQANLTLTPNDTTVLSYSTSRIPRSTGSNSTYVVVTYQAVVYDNSGQTLDPASLNMRLQDASDQIYHNGDDQQLVATFGRLPPVSNITQVIIRYVATVQTSSSTGDNSGLIAGLVLGFGLGTIIIGAGAIYYNCKKGEQVKRYQQQSSSNASMGRMPGRYEYGSGATATGDDWGESDTHFRRTAYDDAAPKPGEYRFPQPQVEMRSFANEPQLQLTDVSDVSFRGGSMGREGAVGGSPPLPPPLRGQVQSAATYSRNPFETGAPETYRNNGYD